MKAGVVEGQPTNNVEKLRVEAGQQLTINQGVPTLKEYTSNELFQKYTNHIRFKDVKLKELYNVIQQDTKQSKNIHLVPEELGERLITIELSDYTIESVSELIALALNLRCQIDDSDIIISK